MLQGESGRRDGRRRMAIALVKNQNKVKFVSIYTTLSVITHLL